MDITQIEGNFWKEKLNLLHNENLLTSKNSQNSLEFEKIDENLTEFKNTFPQYKTDSQLTESSFSMEILFSEKFLLRLFIQNHGQKKISFFQKIDDAFEKNSDAKFMGNPFIDLKHFAENFPSYQNELQAYTQENLKANKKLILTMQIIKALLNAKFRGTQITWKIEIEENNYKLTLKNGNTEKTHYLTVSDFKQQIAELELN